MSTTVVQVVDVVRQVVGVAVDQTQTVVSGEVVRWIDTTTAAALAAHEADTTGVHGIADTSALVVDTDSRLTDARTPTAHAASHADGGTDEITVAQSQVTGLTAALATKAPVSCLWMSGSAGGWVTCPDVAAFGVIDVDIAVRVALDDFTPPAEQYLVGKWNGDSVQSSFYLSILTDGTLRGAWSTTGADYVAQFSSAPLAGTNGVPLWIRLTIDVDDGGVYKVRFYYATDSVDVPAAWTQLGSTLTGAATTSVFDSTAALGVGAISSGSATSTGRYFRAVLLSGIGGTVIADWRGDIPAARYRDTAGNVWTVNGTANAWMAA